MSVFLHNETMLQPHCSPCTAYATFITSLATLSAPQQLCDVFCSSTAYLSTGGGGKSRGDKHTRNSLRLTETLPENCQLRAVASLHRSSLFSREYLSHWQKLRQIRPVSKTTVCRLHWSAALCASCRTNQSHDGRGKLHSPFIHFGSQ